MWNSEITVFTHSEHSAYLPLWTLFFVQFFVEEQEKQKQSAEGDDDENGTEG